MLGSVVILSMLGAAMLSGPASAHPFGPHYADNWAHYYFYDELKPEFVQAAQWNLKNNIDPTRLRPYLASSWNTADVHVFDNNKGDDGYPAPHGVRSVT